MNRISVYVALGLASCHGCGHGGRGHGGDSDTPIRNGKPGPGGGDRACGGSAEAITEAVAATPPTVPNGTYKGNAAHPRIFFTPERLERARGWLKKSDWAPKNDDFLGNAFVYAVAKDPDAGKRAIAFLDKVIAEKLLDSGDNARWQGEIAIVIYDWCFDLVPPATRDAFARYANSAFTKWNADDWGGVGHEEGNYYWGNLRNSLEWGLASSPENATAPALLEDALVKRWEKSFLPYAQGLQRGGVPTEGTQYGRYQEGYPLLAFVTLASGGRKIFDETDWFRGLVYYNIHNTLPGVTTRGDGNLAAHDMFPHEDDEFWLQGNSAIDPEYGDFMTAAAWAWPDKPVGQHARWYLGAVKGKRNPWIEASDDHPAGKPVDLTTIPLDYYAPGPGYLWARNKWSTDASIVFAQLGFARGAGHQHYDSGTFQIWRKGRWLTRETASYIDDVTGIGGSGRVGARETYGHNGILFDGKGSALGNFAGYPAVLRLESRKDYAYGATDLSKWYRADAANHPERDNPAAGSLVREVIYLREFETLVVLDRMEGTSDKVARTFLVHFEQGAKVKTDGAITTAQNGDQLLRVQTLVPAAPTSVRLVDERLKPDDHIGQQRLEITHAPGTAQSYFVTVLQGRDASAPDVTAKVTESAEAFVVTVNTTTITFAKGMASTGGTIQTGGCAAHPLADYVQNIRVTDDGPIWGP